MESVVEDVLAAYGGWEHLSEVRGYRITGRVRSRMRGAEGLLRRSFARPDRLRVQVEYPGTREVRILGGKGKGWRTDGTGRLLEAREAMLGAMELQAARSGLPWILRERLEEVRLLEPMAHGGVRLSVLEIPVGEGLSLRVFVDSGTHRITMSQGLLSMGSMRTHFETRYGDFRWVEGILVPFREENYASGRHTGSTQLETVELNPEFGPTEFSPAGVRAEAAPRRSSVRPEGWAPGPAPP